MLGIEAQGSVGRQRCALLQQFDRDRVGRAHEGHAAVARRAVDGHAQRSQVRAGGVDVVDAEGEVAEVARAAVVFVVVVEGQLDLRLGILRRRRDTPA
jgi:hypothetical protein